MISRRCLAVLGGTLLVLAAASDVAAGGLSKKESQQLDEANRRWRGARCRTRMHLEVKKGREGDGWSNCKWLWWSKKGGNERVRVRVSDGEALRRRFAGGAIPIGSELVASGWDVEKGGGSLYLELELAGLPVRLKVYFYDDWVGRVSVDRIDDFERWARFELLEVLSTPEEQLVAAPAAGPAPRTAAPTPPIRPVATPAAVVLNPALRMVAVAVRPARAAPGDEVRLVVMYELSGLPPATPFEVTETRRLMAGERVLATFEDRVPRTAGTVTSELPVQVPAGLAAGMYALHATASLAGLSADGTAFFQVTPRGP